MLLLNENKNVCLIKNTRERCQTAPSKLCWGQFVDIENATMLPQSSTIPNRSKSYTDITYQDYIHDYSKEAENENYIYEHDNHLIKWINIVEKINNNDIKNICCICIITTTSLLAYTLLLW
jgi:hypothetical protein